MRCKIASKKDMDSRGLGLLSLVKIGVEDARLNADGLFLYERSRG